MLELFDSALVRVVTDSMALFVVFCLKRRRRLSCMECLFCLPAAMRTFASNFASSSSSSAFTLAVSCAASAFVSWESIGWMRHSSRSTAESRLGQRDPPPESSRAAPSPRLVVAQLRLAAPSFALVWLLSGGEALRSKDRLART